jgi:hypothetical protein
MISLPPHATFSCDSPDVAVFADGGMGYMITPAGKELGEALRKSCSDAGLSVSALSEIKYRGWQFTAVSGGVPVVCSLLAGKKWGLVTSIKRAWLFALLGRLPKSRQQVVCQALNQFLSTSTRVSELNWCESQSSKSPNDSRIELPALSQQGAH